MAKKSSKKERNEGKVEPVNDVSTTLTLDKECKSVMRYSSTDPNEPVTTSLYLHNGSYEALGEPESIVVTVEPAGGGD